MNFRAVTLFTATIVLFNVLLTDATFSNLQKGYEISSSDYSNYQQPANAQNVYAQVAQASYPSASAQVIRQYQNLPAASIYPSSYSNNYPSILDNGFNYKLPEQGVLPSMMAAMRACFLRLVFLPIRIIRFIRTIITTFFSLLSGTTPQKSTIGYPMF